MEIIDSHTHPVLFGKGASADELTWLVAYGRKLGIGLMVGLGDVLRHGRNFSAEQIREVNDESARIQAMFPDYFRFFCFLNPTLGERAVFSEVERCVTKFGFIGLKLEICNNARDACMDAVMEAAKKWKIAVLQHSWSQTHLRERSFHSDPEDTANLARRHPEVTVIMPHLTGIGVRGVLEAKGVPNLYVDLSGGLADDGLLEYAVEQLGADHVLYGSDLPIRSPAVALARVTSSRLTAQQKAMILGGNARRILRLNGGHHAV